jgi:hypothetical protein
MLSKVYHEISVSFGPIQNLEISDLAMAKVEKVYIAVTLLQFNQFLLFFSSFCVGLATSSSGDLVDVQVSTS